jgi:hypothetical protein
VCWSDLVDVLLRDLKNIFSLFAKSTATKITQHLINHGHSFNTGESIMKILHFNIKGARLDTIEKLCICKEMMKNSPLNGKYTV